MIQQLLPLAWGFRVSTEACGWCCLPSVLGVVVTVAAALTGDVHPCGNCPVAPLAAG